MQQNAAASEELASTSEEVNAQAQELQIMMGFFTLAKAVEPRGAAARKGAPQSYSRRVPGPKGAVPPAKPSAPGTEPESQFTSF